MHESGVNPYFEGESLSTICGISKRPFEDCIDMEAPSLWIRSSNCTNHWHRACRDGRWPRQYDRKADLLPGLVSYHSIASEATFQTKGPSQALVRYVKEKGTTAYYECGRHLEANIDRNVKRKQNCLIVSVVYKASSF